MNLFSRLYKYQSSDLRSQLENFCTEGLCDILNRMTLEQQHNFLKGIFVPIHSDKPVVWQTQYSIICTQGSIRYPDLVGIVDDSVAYIIEVKIDAQFTIGIDDKGEQISQLEIYDRWLDKHASPNYAPTLILLTNNTQPEEAFLDSESQKYRVLDRRVLYWQNVHDQLSVATDICYVEDYKQFLKQQGLAMDLPTRQDFAVMELLYSGDGRRLEGLMESVFEKLKQKYGCEPLFNWNREDKLRHGGSRANWDYAICWSWVILNKAPYQYFYWGIQFPELDVEWNTLDNFSSNGSSPQIVLGYSTTESEYTRKALNDFSSKGYNVGIEVDGETTIFQSGLPLNKLLEEKYNIDTVVDWLSSEIDQALEIIRTL